LGLFKYYGFFVESFVAAFELFGLELQWEGLQLLLPVGISFYTFQTMSYSIDVFNRKVEATSDPIAFAAFVSFFPQLVAGPIERAASFLPAFSKVESFSYNRTVSGLRQMLWGLFKKVVIADQCAYYVDPVFRHSDQLPGSVLLLGAILFAFQIYGDFSGYTDIAIGVSRIFGFELRTNFRTPYFSRSIAEFWRRWHISLSTWFRDYVYIPLGGNRSGGGRSLINIFTVFLISGFWHGANWTFVLWGAAHAAAYVPQFLIGSHRKHLQIQGGFRIGISQAITFLQVLGTFLLVSLLWVLFRADSVTQALLIFEQIFSISIFHQPYMIEPLSGNIVFPKKFMLLIMVFILVEWKGQEDDNLLDGLVKHQHVLFRWLVYFVLGMSIMLTIGKPVEFIYFQF
jgi:D-alanyl-lipoteichoic acid acyltransferase DltB (MBOAT superfamily)